MLQCFDQVYSFTITDKDMNTGREVPLYISSTTDQFIVAGSEAHCGGQVLIVQHAFVGSSTVLYVVRQALGGGETPHIGLQSYTSCWVH